MAWWERRIARDLYDIYFLHSILGAKINFEVLTYRLKKIEYSRGQKGVLTIKSMNLNEFADNLNIAIKKIEEKKERDNLLDGLRNYFSKEELQGMDMKIFAALRSVLEEVKTYLIAK